MSVTLAGWPGRDVVEFRAWQRPTHCFVAKFYKLQEHGARAI